MYAGVQDRVVVSVRKRVRVMCACVLVCVVRVSASDGAMRPLCVHLLKA